MLYEGITPIYLRDLNRDLQEELLEDIVLDRPDIKEAIEEAKKNDEEVHNIVIGYFISNKDVKIE